MLTSTRSRSSGFNGKEEASNINDQYQSSLLNSLFKKYLEFILTLCNWDLFSIYKSDSHHSSSDTRHLTKSLPELRVRQDNFDRWRTRFRVPLLCLIGYLSGRLFIICTVKIADIILMDSYIFNSTRLHSLSNSSQAQLKEFLLFNPVRKILPSYYRSTIEQVVKYDQLMRDPYVSLSVQTVLLEILMAGPLILMYVIVPLTLRDKVMNSPNHRFMMDPWREILRIDFIIRWHLNRMLIESSKSRLVARQLKQVASLRPNIFTASWYHSSYRYSLTMSGFAMLECIASLILLFTAFYHVTKKDLCAIKQVEECIYSNILTLNDSIYIAEIIMAVFWIAVAFMLVNLVLNYTNIIAQLKMVRGANEDLSLCLKMISAYNVYFSLNQVHYSDRDRFKFNLQLSNLSYLLEDQDRAKEEEIELVLLRTYIKLVVTGDEIKRTAQFLGLGCEVAFELTGFVFFVLCMNYIYTDSKIQPTQIVLLINCYTLTNPVMLLCSYAFSRTIELEKIAWSILAELSTYQEVVQRRGNLRLYNSNEHIEVLARRWRKLVHSYALSDRRIASSPFGLSMTYGQVINIDYFVLTVAIVLIIR